MLSFGLDCDWMQFQTPTGRESNRKIRNFRTWDCLAESLSLLHPSILLTLPFPHPLLGSLGVLRGLELLAKSENFWGVSARARIGEPTLENPIERRGGKRELGRKKKRNFFGSIICSAGEILHLSYSLPRLMQSIYCTTGFLAHRTTTV